MLHGVYKMIASVGCRRCPFIVCLLALPALFFVAPWSETVISAAICHVIARK